MIDFKKLDIAQKPRLEPMLRTAAHRGCSYSFANLYLWGRMDYAVEDGTLLLFHNYQGRSMYPNPVGGDLAQTVERIMEDARQRGIPCRISDLRPEDKEALEAAFPGRFRFHCDRGNFDYVYDINDLADLKGRKYQSKRTRLNRFVEEHPEATVRPLGPGNLEECMAFLNDWYAQRLEAEPHADLHSEKVALCRAMKDYGALGMEGLALYADGKMIAMTMGSFLDETTVDVHFEKADPGYPAGYAAINRAFARYIREKYPAVRFLNREEDVGSEGLRTAKLSYGPHHLIEKCWAHLRDEDYDE